MKLSKKLWQKKSRLPHEIGDDNDEDGSGWKTPAHPAVVCLLLDCLHLLIKEDTKFI